MVKVCPKCGLEYPNAFKFCKEDGAELVEAPQVPLAEAGPIAVETLVRTPSADQDDPPHEVVTSAPLAEGLADPDAKSVVSAPVTAPNQRPSAFMAELPDPEVFEGAKDSARGSARTIVPIAIATLVLLGVGGTVFKSCQKSTPKPSEPTASAKPNATNVSSSTPDPKPASEATAKPATPTPKPAESKPSSTASGLPGERYPQTKDHRLSTSEISAWDYASVRYAINEIYARHGYAFQNPEIRKMFSQFSWYRPAQGVSMEQLERGRLSKVEFANAQLLAARRKELESQGAH